MARDKYLMYLRQQEYKKRIKLKVANTRARMNREYMNQPEVDKETLELWNNQPAIYFDLGGNKWIILKKRNQPLRAFVLRLTAIWLEVAECKCIECPVCKVWYQWAQLAYCL